MDMPGAVSLTWYEGRGVGMPKSPPQYASSKLPVKAAKCVALDKIKQFNVRIIHYRQRLARRACCSMGEPMNGDMSIEYCPILDSHV